MRAVTNVAGERGPTLRVCDVPDPKPGPQDVLVRVRAAGVNRADLRRRQQHFPVQAGTPEIAGLEIAGEIVAVGIRVKGFRPGDRIMAMANGGYAELAAIDHRIVLRVPSDMGWVEAAAVPVLYQTAFDAVCTNGKLRRGETVLIHAVSSGAGLACLQMAKARGAGMVLGTSTSAKKLARLRDLGLDVGIDSQTESFAEVTRQKTADRGANLVIDNVGRGVLAGTMACTALGARIVSVGRMGGQTDQIDLDLLALRRLSLIGVTFRTRSIAEKAQIRRRFEAEVMPDIAAGRLRPVIDRTFPLDQALEAQTYMASNAHLGKIILTV
ncbi:MAG: zinc-binding dehydrogenase [Alphaproteobacteria bacterium]